MTIIVAKDRVLYTDSRKSLAGNVVNDNDVKMTTVKDARWKNGEEIIAIAGAGSVKQIDALTALLSAKGYEGYTAYNNMVKAGLATHLTNVCLVLVCTNKVYTITWHTKMGHLVHRVYDHHEAVCEGSGRHASYGAASLIKTDAIGMVCAAIAMSDTCGGFIRSFDTTQRNPKLVSVYYKYPRLRIIWGMIKVRWSQLKLKFFY